MKVRFNTVYAGLDPATGSPLCVRPGETADFPEAEAKELVSLRYAEFVDQPVSEEKPSGPKSRHRAGRRATKDK